MTPTWKGQHMMDGDNPGDAPVELSPHKHAMITEAIREILAGSRRHPTPNAVLDPDRPPGATDVQRRIKGSVEQREVDAVVREMILEAERIARGPPPPAPPSPPVARPRAVVLPPKVLVRPGVLEVSKAVREAIAGAIQRLGLQSIPPRLEVVRPLLNQECVARID